MYGRNGWGVEIQSGVAKYDKYYLWSGDNGDCLAILKAKRDNRNY